VARKYVAREKRKEDMARAGKVAVRRMIKLLLFILCSYNYCFSFVEKEYVDR